jgi:hypothetical protein
MTGSITSGKLGSKSASRNLKRLPRSSTYCASTLRRRPATSWYTSGRRMRSLPSGSSSTNSPAESRLKRVAPSTAIAILLGFTPGRSTNVNSSCCPFP